MDYTSCPTSVVNAPVEVVWALLMRPEGWGSFYDVRITGVEPAGPAVMGQKVFAESGPRFLHLKIHFRFSDIDDVNHRLGFDARFPFGISVREDLSCVSLGAEQCRVNYHCGFSFPAGWRGAMFRALVRPRLDRGPADSLARLRREAERIHASSLPLPS